MSAHFRLVPGGVCCHELMQGAQWGLTRCRPAVGLLSVQSLLSLPYKIMASAVQQHGHPRNVGCAPAPEREVCSCNSNVEKASSSSSALSGTPSAQTPNLVLKLQPHHVLQQHRGVMPLIRISCSGFSRYMFSCWQATLPGGITPATCLASWTSADSLSGVCQVTVGKITMACSTAHAARYHMTETKPT